jgi:WXG100 family type VII secretion target
MKVRERMNKMAEKIQVDYEGLSQLANQVNKMADEMEKMYSKIVSQTEVLAGSWIGRGASAFQQEMDDLVLPGLKRLYEGLGTTSTNLNQLGVHWKGIEEEATALFPTE